jgi:FKBP-type peptidyl-prolyl cis-trans isomerase
MHGKSLLNVCVVVALSALGGCSILKKSEKPKTAPAAPAIPGLKTTASGLQYQVIKEGTGKQPKATDTVVVHYRGVLMDGREFDSSRTRGPFTTPLNGVIKGWTEGLQLMREGAQYRFLIPPDLAYGAQGMGMIGPNATLLFEIALLQVK